MATERHRVVIDVDYVGERDVERYLAAMRRIGAITQEQQRLAGQLNSSQGPAALASVFGTQAAVAGDYETRAQAAIASTKALQRETETLRRSVEALQRSFRSVPSGGFGELRQQLTDVLVANQVMRQIQDAGSRFSANQATLPGGIPAGTPQYQLNRLSGAYVAPSKELQSVARLEDRYQRVLQASIDGQLELGRAQSAAAAQTRRTTAAQRRLEQEANRAIAALPVGRGLPRRGDYGLTPAGAFMARDAATGIEQARFLEGLRERINAERALVTQISRTEGFYNRLAGLESRGAILDMTPGGGTTARWESTGSGVPPEIQDLSVRLRALNREVDAAYEGFRVTNQARNREAYAINQATLQAKAMEYSSKVAADERYSHIVADQLAELADRQPTRTAEQMLFYQGIANATLLKGLHPETREALVGSPEHPRTLGYTTSYGAEVPGLYGRDQVLAHMRAEAVGPLEAQRDAVAAQLAAAQAAYAQSRGLPLGATMAAQPQNQAVIREATAAVQAFTTAVRQAEQTVRAREDAAFRALPPLYHGTARELPTRLLPMDQVMMQHGQQYGMGTYFTTSPGVARDYATSQASAGNLYQLTHASLGKIFDLTQAIPTEDLARLENLNVAAISGVIQMARGGDDFGVPIAPRTLTWQGLFEGIANDRNTVGREYLTDYIRAYKGDPAALRYAGGTFTDSDIKHDAYVFLRPEELEVGKVRSFGPWERASTAIAPHPTLSSRAHADALDDNAKVTAQVTDAERRRLAAVQRAAAAAAGTAGTTPYAIGGAVPPIGGGGGRGGGFGGGGTGAPPPPPPGGGNWWDPIDRDMSILGPQGYSKILAAQAQLHKAEIDLQNVKEKGKLPYGSKGAFRDDIAATTAYAAAVARAQRAHEGLNRAMGQTAAPVNMGVQQGPGFPLNQGVYGPQLTNLVNQGLQSQGVLPQAPPLQAAQQNLAQAQQNLAQATKAHQQTMSGHYKTTQQASTAYASSLGNLTAAQQAHTTAQQRMANTQRWLAAGAGGGSYGGGGGFGPFGGSGFQGPPTGPTGGGFFSNFYGGFRGNPDRSYAEMLGQTARFSVMYGAMYNALFMLTQTLQFALQEGILFQQAMTDLSIAAQRPKEELEELATSVGASAVEAGFAPSQGVQIAARAMGLYGVTNDSLATQEQVGRISAQVVSRMAVGSPKDPVTLQQDVAAIVQALGMDPTGQQRIADIDAYMSKRFGVEQGTSLEALAQSASVGVAAGFSHEELAAIAADMMSRTGQTSSAVGGFMAQIFSRGGEGSLVDVARKQGIDPDQDLRAIITQLAALYDSAAPREQAEISAAFGRGKIQNAAVALLGDYDEVMSASGGARSDAYGMADRTFRERMNNLGGELAVLSGLFKEFASQIGEAGLLDVIALGVVLLQEFLEAVNGVLSLWNMLGDTTQRVVLAMAALLVAIRSETVQRALTNNALRVQGAAGALPLGAAGPLPQVTRGAAMMGIAGTAMGALLNPITLAVGGLLAVGALANSARRMKDASDAAAAALNTSLPVGATAADYRNQASYLTTQADESRRATGWFMNAVTFGQGNNDSIADAERLESEAKRLIEIAERLEATESRSEFNAPVFNSLASSDIDEGLKEITTSGGTAAERLTALRDVLYGTAAAAAAAAENFDPEHFAEENAGQLLSAAGSALSATRTEVAEDGTRTDVPLHQFTATDYVPTAMGDQPVPGARTGADLLPDLQEVLTPELIQERLLAATQSRGIQSLAAVDRGTAEEIATEITAGVAAGLPELTPEGQAAAQEIIHTAMVNHLMDLAMDAGRTSTGVGWLSPEEATAIAQAIVGESDTKLDGLGETDGRTRIAEVRQRLQDLRKIASQTRDPVPEVLQKMAEARTLLVEEQLSELERLRRVAMQNAKNKAEINRVGRAFLEREIARVVNNGSADQLAELIAAAGKGAIGIARSAIEDALKTARAALIVGMEMAVFGQEVAGQVRGMAAAWRTEQGEGANSETLAEIERLEKMLDGLSEFVYADPDNNKFRASGMDVYNPNFPKDEKEKEKLEKDKETAAERAAAQAEAMAVRSQGSMDAARASILSAQAAIAKADRNSVAYWNAMGQLFGAQNALADAVRQYQANLRLLEIDITNPLQEARAATAAVAKKLADDLASGKAEDVIAQDRVDLRRAQASEEATKFQQRLSTVQTAEELGRISHQRYINYLENEKNRLESIKNRTFQQQDQLDQIDRLLQGAAEEMQGQFNLGDINLPTPYQVRRYIEQTSGAQSARQAQLSSVTTNNVAITINGDAESIRREITKWVGRPGRTLTAAPRRGR